MASPRYGFLLALAGSLAVHGAVLILPGMEFEPRPGQAPVTVVKVTLGAVQNEPVGAEKPLTRERGPRPVPRPERVVAKAAPREEPVPEPAGNPPFIAPSAVENQPPRVAAPAPEAPLQLATVSKARASEPDYVARYLHNPPPSYPWQARRMGVEGRVVLHVEILPNGNTGRIDIRQSSGHELLDQAAIRAVGAWRFDPARVAGEPITA
ncbi:MAG: energy transducer TonB, partial [Burkholderiales bacterium]|nr:energy transducer TonB [Burkholderiales bacterium]